MRKSIADFVHLPCTLHFADGRAEARVRNINETGVKTALPQEFQTHSLHALRSAEIAQDGRFAVSVRWQDQKHAGLTFSNRQVARPLVRALLRASGQEI